MMISRIDVAPEGGIYVSTCSKTALLSRFKNSPVEPVQKQPCRACRSRGTKLRSTIDDRSHSPFKNKHSSTRGRETVGPARASEAAGSAPP